MLSALLGRRAPAWQPACRRWVRWQRPVRSSGARVEYGRASGPLDDGHYWAWGDGRDSLWERASRVAARNRAALARLGLVAGVAGAYYWTHVEEAPVTRRRRFISVSRETEAALGDDALRQTLSALGARLLPAHAGAAVRVQRVVDRLAAAAQADGGLRDALPARGFRARVVDAPDTPNAMVLPTGDIFVFSGLLDVADTDARLAAVLGHEMAHAHARHAAEQLSARRFWALLASAVRALVAPDASGLPEALARELLVHLPYSRRCEAEADRVGLLLMASACYHPRAACELWAAMARHPGAAGGAAARVPSFLSTHPPHGERMRRISACMPEALSAYEAAGCADALRRGFRL